MSKRHELAQAVELSVDLLGKLARFVAPAGFDELLALESVMERVRVLTEEVDEEKAGK